MAKMSFFAAVDNIPDAPNEWDGNGVTAGAPISRGSAAGDKATMEGPLSAQDDAPSYTSSTQNGGSGGPSSNSLSLTSILGSNHSTGSQNSRQSIGQPVSRGFTPPNRQSPDISEEEGERMDSQGISGLSG